MVVAGSVGVKKTARIVYLTLFAAASSVVLSACQSDPDIDITKLTAEAEPADTLYNQGLANLNAGKVGEASQDNSIVTNFARDLKLALTGAGIDVKLYAPRGTLDYDIVEETRLGQTVPVVTRIFIDTPERQYPLSEGMLLVQ